MDAESQRIAKSKARRAGKRELPLFTVVVEQEIGGVYHAENGEHPEVSAFVLIGRHGAPGTYRFPREDGGSVHVTVEHESLRIDPEDM